MNQSPHKKYRLIAGILAIIVTLLSIERLTAQPSTQPAVSDFLRRVEDRNLREAFQNQNHVVVRDEDFQGPPATQPTVPKPLPEPNPSKPQPNASTQPAPLKSKASALPIIVGIALPLFVVILALARKKNAISKALQSAGEDASGKKPPPRKRRRR